MNKELREAIAKYNLKEARAKIKSITEELRSLFKENMTSDELTKFDNLKEELEETRSREKAIVVEDKAKIETETRTAFMKNLQSIEKPSGENRSKDEPIYAEGSRVKQKRHFDNLFQQVRAIKQIAHTGEIDVRQKAVETECRASGMNSLVGSDGAFLIEPEFAAMILKDSIETGNILGRVTQYETTSNEVKWKNIKQVDNDVDNGVMGGVKVYWSGEAGTVDPSKMKIGTQKLELNKLMGIAYTTDELSEDAVFMSNLYRTSFSRAISRKLEYSIIWGNGTGQPLGFMNSPSLITVSKEAGQPAGSFVYQNIINMVKYMPVDRRANMVWLINNFAESELETMTFPVGTGGVPVFLPSGGLNDTPYNKLRSRPIIPTDLMSAKGVLGDFALVDLSDYMLLKKGGNLDGKFEVSMHVRFLYGEDTFRIILRIGGRTFTMDKILPNNSTTEYISPYVTLAART